VLATSDPAAPVRARNGAATTEDWTRLPSVRVPVTVPADGAWRLVGMLVAAATIPLLLFAGWVTYLTADRARTAAWKAAKLTSARVASRIADELSSHLRLAEALSESTALDAPDLGDFYAEASRIKLSNFLWYTIELADPSGMQVLNLLRQPDAPLGRLRPGTWCRRPRGAFGVAQARGRWREAVIAGLR